MNLSAQELTVVGALLGAFIGGLFGFLTAWLAKRSEERKAFKELVVRVASEQYMHEIDSTLKSGGGVVMPYQVYLVEMLQLARIANKWFLTPKRVQKLLNRGYKITDAVTAHAKERTLSRSKRKS